MSDGFRLRLYGDPCLARVCREFRDAADVRHYENIGLLAAMVKACHGEEFGQKGLGLAANQVGGNVRVVLAPIHQRETFLFNPEIVGGGSEYDEDSEGCLSVPGFYIRKPRLTHVTVQYRDREFAPHTCSLEWLEARVVQHEIDHLDGKQITDGLSRQQRRQAERCVAKAAA